jgi:chromosome segregation ATPase
MDLDGKRRGLALLEDTRQELLSELGELADKRKDLEAQLGPPWNELHGVDARVKATRRMLDLVEATEQQLAAQGHEELHESRPDHSSVEDVSEVRGRAPTERAVLV